MTDSSRITELTTVARGFGFEVVFPVDRGALPGQDVGVQLHGNGVHFDGTLGEGAAFLVGWGTLRSRVLGELHVIDVQGAPDISGQFLLRGGRVEGLPPMPVVSPLQDLGSQDVPPAGGCSPREAKFGAGGLMRGASVRSPEVARGKAVARSGEGDSGVRALDRLLSRDRRQAMITAWAELAFGREEATGLPQRGLRLLEEAIETFQACGGAAEIAHELVTFMFTRPCGAIGQELGGVAVSLLALAEAAGLSADAEECREIHRVLSKPVEEFSRRNASRNAAGFKMTAAIAPGVSG